MVAEIRMKDTRDEAGTGQVIVEIQLPHGGWTTISQVMFHRDVPHDIDIHHDDIEEIKILQMTKPRFTWTKQQRFNKDNAYGLGRNYNFTIVARKESPRKRKCQD